MTKPKQPMLSLGAKGSIGKAITFQKTGAGQIARAMPTPAYRRTLLQQYVRWRYQDALAAWERLTILQKSAWRSAAVPYHMPGISYFISDYLTNLPGLVGEWRMDQIVGSQVLDSSPNPNYGIVFGALMTPGVIGNCLSFDGIDDYVNCGRDPSLNIYRQGSLLAFVNLVDPQVEAFGTILRKGNTFHWQLWDWMPYVEYWNGVAWKSAGLGNPNLIPGQDTHIAVTWEQESASTRWHFYFDGIWKSTDLIAGTPASDPTRDFYIGGAIAVRNLTGKIDHPQAWNVVVPETDILRHAGRRYP